MSNVSEPIIVDSRLRIDSGIVLCIKMGFFEVFDGTMF